MLRKKTRSGMEVCFRQNLSEGVDHPEQKRRGETVKYADKECRHTPSTCRLGNGLQSLLRRREWVNISDIEEKENRTDQGAAA
jgi:hypothetical protein